MRTARDIAWLAGLLEGEGCFGIYANTPRITLSMTDRDVVSRALAVMRPASTAVYTKKQRGLGSKLVYEVAVTGHRAVGWMLTLFSFLGDRRRERIREVIGAWVEIPTRNSSKTTCPAGHEYTPDNTLRSGGSRKCRECSNARRRVARKEAA